MFYFHEGHCYEAVQVNSNPESLSRWLLFGILSIPLVLLTYFYFLLHLGFGLPLKTLVYPALAFCAFIPFFSVLTCLGYRARRRGKSGVVMFIALGAFALLCGFEFRLETQIHGSSTSSGLVVGWASASTVAGYYVDKWLRNATLRNPQG